MHSSDNKYIKKVYELLRSDIETQPNCINWYSLVRDLISTLGFLKSGSIKMLLMLNCFCLMLSNVLETTSIRDGMVDYRIQAGQTFIKTLQILVFGHI